MMRRLVLVVLLMGGTARADVRVTFAQPFCENVVDGWRLYAAALDPPGPAMLAGEIANVPPIVCDDLSMAATVAFSMRSRGHVRKGPPEAVR